MRNFSELTEREILALAIGLEEEDGRIYSDLVEVLSEDYPASAAIFRQMMVEEGEHRRELIDLYRDRFGDHIPLIRRTDIKGFLVRKPIWNFPKPNIDDVRKLAESMEAETMNFYRTAASRSSDVSIRKLLGDLAEAEARHEKNADHFREVNLTPDIRESEDGNARRNFVLRYIQPGLAGLMDGSVSTLAPIFAAAFATQRPFEAFLVGIAASIGAGISMAFAEAVSDDGSLTGRGTPIFRGGITGVMTALGGLGHTLPFLIPEFQTALGVAIAVVVAELAVISWIRWKYMNSSLITAATQVALGGGIVFGFGILIGNS
jgi:erythrin-vacuolar iron transport family protein